MTTPTTTKRNETMQHLKDVLAGDLAAHLKAEHGHDGDLPTSKAALARLHVEHHTSKPQPEPTTAEPKTAAKPAPARAARKTGDPAADRAARAANSQPKAAAAKSASKAAAAKAAPKAQPADEPTITKAQAKNELFRAVMLAISEMFESADGSEIWMGLGKAEAMKIVSQAIHHFPTGKDADGSRVWPGVLPRPDRSDWR